MLSMHFFPPPKKKIQQNHKVSYILCLHNVTVYFKGTEKQIKVNPAFKQCCNAIKLSHSKTTQ